MGTPARVENVDLLRAFRTTLVKFAEAANVALSDAEGEIHRTMVWLEGEAPSYWQGQIRKRQELVSRAREAVRQKKVFKDSTGGRPSAVDEEKALAKAMRALQEAEEKFAAVKRARARLQKELDLYKGSVQRFATDVQVGIPAAVSKLDKLTAALEAYLALTMQPAELQPAGTEQGGSDPWQVMLEEDATGTPREQAANPPAGGAGLSSDGGQAPATDSAPASSEKEGA